VKGKAVGEGPNIPGLLVGETPGPWKEGQGPIESQLRKGPIEKSMS